MVEKSLQSNAILILYETTIWAQILTSFYSAIMIEENLLIDLYFRNVHL